MGSPTPTDIQIIGDEPAMKWSDGHEDYFTHEYLRAESPSAVNKGEVDVLGQKHGGSTESRFPGVKIKGWDYTGNYGMRITFSDGHNTGIFSWDYLRKLGSAGDSS